MAVDMVVCSVSLLKSLWEKHSSLFSMKRLYAVSLTQIINCQE